MKIPTVTAVTKLSQAVKYLYLIEFLGIKYLFHFEFAGASDIDNRNPPSLPLGHISSALMHLASGKSCGK